jgi:hypothetical protein
LIFIFIFDDVVILRAKVRVSVLLAGKGSRAKICGQIKVRVSVLLAGKGSRGNVCGQSFIESSRAG